MCVCRNIIFTCMFVCHAISMIAFLYSLSFPAIQNLRKMEGETQEPARDLDELQNSDWVTGKHSLCRCGGCPLVALVCRLNKAMMEPHLLRPCQARFWVQVMRDLRDGVKLKKVQERQYNPLAIEYQLTPYEMLMDDIRSKRYKLRKVMVREGRRRFQRVIFIHDL